MLELSAIFVFCDISGHEDKYFSQKYALAMLLYDLSLLISSELSRPSIGKMARWRFILEDTMVSSFCHFAANYRDQPMSNILIKVRFHFNRVYITICSYLYVSSAPLCTRHMNSSTSTK